MDQEVIFVVFVTDAHVANIVDLWVSFFFERVLRQVPLRMKIENMSCSMEFVAIMTSDHAPSILGFILLLYIRSIRFNIFKYLKNVVMKKCCRTANTKKIYVLVCC